MGESERSDVLGPVQSGGWLLPAGLLLALLGRRLGERKHQWMAEGRPARSKGQHVVMFRRSHQ